LALIYPKKHVASILSLDGESLVEPIKFSNDNDSFCRFISFIETFDTENLIIGLESTVYYGVTLASYLYDLNFKVCVINPIEVSALRKNNIHKIKNGKVDTYLIAKALRLKPHRFVK